MLSTATTHVSLLARLSEGPESAAWREFSQRYGELIYNYGRRRGLQPADCDDLVQEVLLSLTRAMRGFVYNPEKGRFRSYLKAVTVRAIPRIVRREATPLPLEELERAAAEAADRESRDDDWDEEWRSHHVRRAMRLIEVEFGGPQLRAFQRYAAEGVHAHLVAEALHLSVNQVYQAKSRILRRLAELVHEQVLDEG